MANDITEEEARIARLREAFQRPPSQSLSDRLVQANKDDAWFFRDAMRHLGVSNATVRDATTVKDKKEE